MIRLRGWTAGSRVALAGVLACCALCAIALRAALRVAPLTPLSAGATVAALPAPPQRRAMGSDTALVLAVARSPFRADRSRPPGRYRLPGEAVTASRPANARRWAPPSAMKLLGTASFPDGSGLAAIAVRGGPPRLVRVGQQLDGMTLIDVEPGAATLTRPDTTIVLRVSGPAQSDDR